MMTLPPPRTTQSLSGLHPRQSWVVLSTLLLSTALLGIALSLPLLDAETGILWKHWRSSYSVWAGVVALWNQREPLLALIVFAFSMVFPIVKLVTLGIIWFMRLAEARRVWLLRWLEALGKWSMLDVFVVAILIVLVKLGPLANVKPRAGVYVFTAAIVCSMLTTRYVESIARPSLRADPNR